MIVILNFSIVDRQNIKVPDVSNQIVFAHVQDVSDVVYDPVGWIYGDERKEECDKNELIALEKCAKHFFKIENVKLQCDHLCKRNEDAEVADGKRIRDDSVEPVEYPEPFICRGCKTGRGAPHTNYGGHYVRYRSDFMYRPHLTICGVKDMYMDCSTSIVSNMYEEMSGNNLEFEGALQQGCDIANKGYHLAACKAWMTVLNKYQDLPMDMDKFINYSMQTKDHILRSANLCKTQSRAALGVLIQLRGFMKKNQMRVYRGMDIGFQKELDSSIQFLGVVVKHEYET